MTWVCLDVDGTEAVLRELRAIEDDFGVFANRLAQAARAIQEAWARGGGATVADELIAAQAALHGVQREFAMHRAATARASAAAQTYLERSVSNHGAPIAPAAGTRSLRDAARGSLEQRTRVLAQQLHAELEKRLPKSPSAWSLVIKVDPDLCKSQGAVGQKRRECSISIDADEANGLGATQTLLHELLHAKTPGLFDQLTGLKLGWEEGIIEGATRYLWEEVVTAAGIEIHDGHRFHLQKAHAYDSLVGTFRLVARHAGVPPKQFFTTMVGMSYEKRREHVKALFANRGLGGLWFAEYSRLMDRRLKLP